jgi:hypothetical protein
MVWPSRQVCRSVRHSFRIGRPYRRAADSTVCRQWTLAAFKLQFYAISYYFPSNWDGTQLSGDSESWSYVMQFHPNNTGALIGLGASRTGPGLAQKYYFQGDQQHDLANGSLITLGAWTDFIFQLNWSSGALNIYRRDQGATKFTLVLSINEPAMLPDSNGGYFKQGLYRGPDVNGRTDVLWIGPTARGTSFSSVEQAAFGTNNGF